MVGGRTTLANVNAPNPYRLMVEPVGGLVTARAGTVTLAETGAARMMHETRVTPVVYFPSADVRHDLLRPSDHRTFCPFKGTATYWDVVLPDRTIVNGAWTYSRTLPEAVDIEGYIAFMPGIVTEYRATDGFPPATRDGHVSGPLIDWVTREAWQCDDPVELVEHLAERFRREGIAVMRLSIMIRSLHPEIAGVNYIWRRDTDAVRVFDASYQHLQQPQYVNSPLRHVADGLGGVRQPLTADETEFSFPIMAELKAQGATDYVAMPLPLSTGQMNVMTLACDHPAGFTTANLGVLFECSAVIGRYFEVFALRANAVALLDTYLGKRTGARVLGGEIRRGDGENISAAIVLCDLRESSKWAELTSRGQYLKLLNAFFDAAAGPVTAHGGEVLKLIGDAVLAVFPDEGGANRACSAALSAAKAIADAVPQIPSPVPGRQVACATGVSFGNVTYGNVGSADRLDFTVIGTAANVAARLGELGKTLGYPVVASARVAQATTDPMVSLGAHTLRNVSTPVEVFVCAEDVAQNQALETAASE